MPAPDDIFESGPMAADEDIGVEATPDIDSDDEYFDIFPDILEEELNPSRPPSPVASIHDVSDEELEPEETHTSNPNESPFVARTRGLREGLKDVGDEEMEKRLLCILDSIQDCGLDLPLFLDAVCWGRPCAVQNGRIRYARTTLMCSDELPAIIGACLKPPRWNSSTRKRRATGGRKSLAPVVRKSCIETMQQEMAALGPLLETSTATDVQAAQLTGFSFPSLHAQMLDAAPTLVQVIDSLSGRRQSPIITATIISQLMYRHNRRFNRLQKTYAVYFKFKGLSAKGFDVLHGLGLVMSHTWISDAIQRISKFTLEELRELVQKHPWVLTYDNVVILFKVFSQRLHNLQKLSSGTAATVYIKPGAIPFPASANAELKKQRALALSNPISQIEIWELEHTNYGRLQPHFRWIILSFLLDSPAFDLAKYKYKNDPKLKQPEPLKGLPTGPDAKWLQRLLGSLNRPEASYADHEKLIEDWLKQLNMWGKNHFEKIGLEKVIAFIGDQLTVARLRGLFLRRFADDNSFERLDPYLWVRGWLHHAMASGNSIHTQYLGRAKGDGLLACFNLLHRKGLHKSSTEGPFYAHLNEALSHIAEAHFLEIWRLLSPNPESDSAVSQLRSKTPTQLLELADRVLEEYASSAALRKMRQMPEERQDQVQQLNTQFARDILPHLALIAAMKRGDIGVLEASLTAFLFRCIGGGNHNYQEETLELLNGLLKEWPPSVADFVRQNCWLLTFTGRPNSYLPFDQAQEHNIKDIKVTYKPTGPRGGWDYMHTLHPAIPTIRQNADFVDQAFNTLTRGKKHTAPKKEADIQKLLERFRGVHSFVRGRRLPSAEDKAEDYYSLGGQAWISGDVRDKWMQKRMFERSTEEKYVTPGVVSDDSHSGSSDSGDESMVQ